MSDSASTSRTIGELVAEVRALRREIDMLRSRTETLVIEVDEMKAKIRVSTAWAIGLVIGIGAMILGAKEALRRAWEALWH